MSESRKSFKNFIGAFCSQPEPLNRDAPDDDFYFHKSDKTKNISLLSRRSKVRDETGSLTQPPFLIRKTISPNSSQNDSNNTYRPSGNVLSKSLTPKSTKTDRKPSEIPLGTQKMFEQIRQKVFEGKVGDIDNNKILQNIEKQIKSSPVEVEFESVLKDSSNTNKNLKLFPSKIVSSNLGLSHSQSSVETTIFTSDLPYETSPIFKMSRSKFVSPTTSNKRAIAFKDNSVKSELLPDSKKVDRSPIVVTSTINESKENIDSKSTSDVPIKSEDVINLNVSLLNKTADLNETNNPMNCSLITNDETVDMNERDGILNETDMLEETVIFEPELFRNAEPEESNLANFCDSDIKQKSIELDVTSDQVPNTDDSSRPSESNKPDFEKFEQKSNKVEERNVSLEKTFDSNSQRGKKVGYVNNDTQNNNEKITDKEEHNEKAFDIKRNNGKVFDIEINDEKIFDIKRNHEKVVDIKENNEKVVEIGRNDEEDLDIKRNNAKVFHIEENNEKGFVGTVENNEKKFEFVGNNEEVLDSDRSNEKRFQIENNDESMFYIESKVGDVFNNTAMDTTFEVNRVCDEIITELDDTVILESPTKIENASNESLLENNKESSALIYDSQFELSSSLLQKIDDGVLELPKVIENIPEIPLPKPKLVSNILRPIEHKPLPPLPTLNNHQIDWAARIKAQCETLHSISVDIGRINSTINRYRSSLVKKPK